MEILERARMVALILDPPWSKILQEFLEGILKESLKDFKILEGIKEFLEGFPNP